MKILTKAMIEKWVYDSIDGSGSEQVCMDFCINDAITLFKIIFHQFNFVNCFDKSFDLHRLLVALCSFLQLSLRYYSSCSIPSSYVAFLLLNSARTSHPAGRSGYVLQNEFSRHRSLDRVEVRVLKDFQVSFGPSRCNRSLNSSGSHCLTF